MSPPLSGAVIAVNHHGRKPVRTSDCNYKSDSTTQGIKVTIAVPAIRNLKLTDGEMGGAPEEKGGERVAEAEAEAEAAFVLVSETGARVVGAWPGGTRRHAYCCGFSDQILPRPCA